MEFINYHSKVESIKLAKERGSFPAFSQSFYLKGRLPFKGIEEKESWHLDWREVKEKIKKQGLRNAHTTAIAPTGSISMIAGCSSGIEPVFSLVFEKKVTVGSFYYVDPVFEKVMSREGLFDEDLIREVSQRKGSVQDLNYIPERLKKIFVTAMDISAKDHIRALAAFQKWTDSAISKTINFPNKASVEDIKKSFLMAYNLGCKGITVFRHGSIEGVLQIKEEKRPSQKSKKEKPELISLKDVKSKGPSIYHEAGVIKGKEEQKENIKTNNQNNKNCPLCGTSLIITEGCRKCPLCGWGSCSL
jgi:ribonucleoside-diphosphate reductase alpha chain